MARPVTTHIALRLLHSLFCAICLLLSGVAFAQRYPFYNLNVDDGLVQSQATCITQDPRGNIWVGTLGGVSRYDGKNFTNYKVRNGLPSNAVWAIASDTHDNIWIATTAGVSKYDGRTFKHYARPKQTIRNISNTQQLFVVNDTVWWRVQGEVFFIAAGKVNKLSLPGEEVAVTTMYVDNGNLWLAKGGVVYHLHGKQWTEVEFPGTVSPRPPAVYRIAYGSEGLWVVTNAGVYKLEDDVLILHMPNPAGMPQPISVTEDRAGAIWLGTNSGVIRTDDRIQYFNKQNGLRDNAFLDMFTDASGNVWMLSDGQGLFRFSGTQFTVLDESTGLPSAQISAMAAAGPDSLFLGSYEAGLCAVSRGTIHRLEFPTRPAPSIASLFYDDERSLLWIGTRGKGLWMYDGRRFTQFDAATYGLPSNFINSVYKDDADRLWLGFSSGAAVLEKDTFKVLPIKNLTVVSFLSIGADSMLIATDRINGLLLYHDGRVIDFITKTAADSSNIQCFVKDGNDLWLGSSDNGVVLYNMASHTATVINESSGLRSDFIYNIIEGQDGDVWVGTGFGIHRIRIRKDARGQLIDDPEITFYGKAHGITGMESNINSVLKLPDESIWFGTTNGAVHYQPNTTVVSSQPSSIVLLSVKLTGEPMIAESYYDSADSWYGIPYHLRLPSRKNNLSFIFQAIAPAGAEQSLYRYRLEGLEAPWSDWSQANTASYSALPPGNYVLHVQCRGADDQNVKELTYAFEIITPLHKTMLFRALVLAACILLGISLQYAVHRARQRRQRLLARLRAEEQNKIRVSTAEDFHDEIGNKLTRISVLTNVLKSKLSPDPDTLRILGQIEDNTAQLYSGTRDILWSLKPSNDTLYEVLVRIRDFGMELFQDTEVTFSFDGINDAWQEYRLPINMSRNLIMIFKEALNNTLKYAKANKVWIQAGMTADGTLELLLKDDGTGFDIANVHRGNGLNNMEIRTGRLNGKLVMASEKGKGTSISLAFKIPPKR